MAAAGILTVVIGLLFITIPLHAQTESIDIKVEGKALVTSIRDIVARAKEGSSLVADVGDLEGLQNAVFNLITRLPALEESETQTVIKLAAAAIGSHEVLGGLLAGSDVDMQSSRIGLSFALLDCAAQLLDDKLARSLDVGPELFAISFGAITTIDIIKTSDATIKKKMALAEQGNRGRQNVVPFLGRGFYISSHVVRWRDTTGSHVFHVGLSRAPVLPHGLKHVQRRSPRLTGGVSASVGSGSGSVYGSLGWRNPNGGLSTGISGGVNWSPAWAQNILNGNLGWTNPETGLSGEIIPGISWGSFGTQPSINGNLGWTSPDGRVSSNVNGGVTWAQGVANPNVAISVSIKF